MHMYICLFINTLCMCICVCTCALAFLRLLSGLDQAACQASVVRASVGAHGRVLPGLTTDTNCQGLT